MEHWLAVGSDIWWVIRWPLLCGLWFLAGICEAEMHKAVHLLIILAIVTTLIVANS